MGERFYSFMSSSQLHHNQFASQQPLPMGDALIGDFVHNPMTCLSIGSSQPLLSDLSNDANNNLNSMRFYSNNKFNLQPASACQYAPWNGNSGWCNRNRYIPYSYSRACATTAAAIANHAHGTGGSFTGKVTPTSYSYQQFASIYQNYPTLMQTINPPKPLTGLQSIYERPCNNKTNATVEVVHPSYSTCIKPREILPSLNMSNNLGNPTKNPSPENTASNFLSTSISNNLPQSSDATQPVTLQITNLDYSMDEASLRNFLMGHLKSITPVISLVFEGSSFAKVTVPDLVFAKQVVSNLHRKKIGHKRMVVSYTRDSSLTEINTLRCQVAGLLKDVPYYTLPMYKFRELFQSRFKTSISVLDLYKMQDICTINSDNNEEKFISLQPELINSLENSPLIEGLQHSVPYCTIHFKREQHKGWAEQEMEPLPNVYMTIAEIQKIIYPLLRSHPGDIPVSSLVHCIEGELNIQIKPHENGVNLEHLICCVQGIQIQVNNFGIKILGWLELDKENASTLNVHTAERTQYGKNSTSDPLYQISREVVELVKMSPKSAMKFNRFIPAYHNHFGKQCRVADYGYTKLIELFEALSSVVQIMGDGENRQITLTHRTQIRRFTSDLLRVMRAHGNKSVLLSQLPTIFAQTQNRHFDVTDYGVCDITDILDGLVNSNVVVVSSVQNGNDLLISIPKRKQTNTEIEKTSIFASEMVELFRNAPQYTILFQKFVRSYHYHFAYQCRLSDYGFLKLADLMEAISGIVEMELTSDEDKKIFLTPIVARRVFAEQCEELIRDVTGASNFCMKFSDVLELHKKRFGYQLQPQSMGVEKMSEAVPLLPYVEVIEKEECIWIICHNEDANFRNQCYRVVKYILAKSKHKNDHNENQNMSSTEKITVSKLLTDYSKKYNENLTESSLRAMKHAIEIKYSKNMEDHEVQLTNFMTFLLNAVRVLEQKPSMLLNELKNALHCHNTTTFEFGFPNLFSILTAYSDIFAVSIGVTQERSEISLQPNSELRLCQSGRQHLFGSLKLPASKLKPARSIRMPLAEIPKCMSNPCEPPLNSCVKSDDIRTNANKPSSTSSHSIGIQVAQNIQGAFIPSTSCCQQLNMNGNNSSMNSKSLQSINSLNSSSTLSNKENSLNSSFNNFNNSLNLSGTSFSDLNGSITSSTSCYSNLSGNSVAKLWDRRKSAFGGQMQISDENICKENGLLPLIIPPRPTSSAVSVTASVENNMEKSEPNSFSCDNMPFWSNPIWSNFQMQKEAQEKDSLNIKLPEMKSLNVVPLLLSPYTLSKFENMKQQDFNFENLDRKIA